jgi:hypothetical protein
MQGSKRVNIAGTSALRGSIDTSSAAVVNEDTVQTLRSKVVLLEKDLERRQESYIVRERAFKTRIDELESELENQRQSKTGWMKSDTKMAKLKGMQQAIIENVELVQDRTAKVLQEQERDLLRAFRARLFDVQTELEKEKSKKEDGASAWMDRSRQLEAELEWTKEVADRLERVNQTLLQENNRLKSQFKSQEEDRGFLIKQLVAVKKDNAKLRGEFVALEEENGCLRQDVADTRPTPGGGTGTGTNTGTHEATSTNGAVHAKRSTVGRQSVVGGGLPTIGSQQQQADIDMDDRYKDINKRLRRLLAEERKSLQTVRQNYAVELANRTDMELLLRKCVEDVRKEIARRRIEANNVGGSDLVKLYSRNPGAIPVEEFTQDDRERALELLLSQERVVTLLYAKTFPISKSSQVQAVGGSTQISIDVPELGQDGAQETTAVQHRPSTSGGLLPAIISGQVSSLQRPQTSGEYT